MKRAIIPAPAKAFIAFVLTARAAALLYAVGS